MSGVAGLLLQKGQEVLVNRMPYAAERTEKLCAMVQAMCVGYQRVGRTLKQVLLTFDLGTLLVMNYQDLQLVLLMSGDAEIDVIAEAMAQFMRDHLSLIVVTDESRKATAPISLHTPKSAGRTTTVPVLKVENYWPEVRQRLEVILSKTLNSAQMNSLIERVLQNSNVPESRVLSFAEARIVALNVLSEIPHRGRRRELTAELESALVALRERADAK